MKCKGSSSWRNCNVKFRLMIYDAAIAVCCNRMDGKNWPTRNCNGELSSPSFVAAASEVYLYWKMTELRSRVHSALPDGLSVETSLRTRD